MKTADEHQLVECKLNPQEQLSHFLRWFSVDEACRFDIHLRCPDNSARKNAYWITCHEAVSANRIQELWPWLRYKNANGCDVYFRPHRHDNHKFLFLDDLSCYTAQLVARKYACAVVETSPNNTQVWMKTTRSISLTERKEQQRYLSQLGYNDPGSISGDHLGRLCGLVSHKRNCWVNVKSFSTPTNYEPASISSSTHRWPGGARVLKNSKKKHSCSEREFGWVIAILNAGVSIKDAQQRLQRAAENRKRSDPERYAVLTVQNAIRTIGIDEV